MELYRKKIFPALAGILWACFLFLDLTEMADSTWVKFAAICLCCVTALLGAKTTDGRLVAVALCFTVAADWFLLVMDNNYESGIGLFIIVQLLYAYRLYHIRGKKLCVVGIIFRVSGVFLFLFLFLLGGIWFASSISAFFQSDFMNGNGNLLSVLLSFLFFVSLPGVFPALFYFSNLVINTAEAFALKKATFAWGLLLFVCCDICVGAYNLDLLPALTFPGMWLFYLPSQVLIVLSQETGDIHEKAF